MLTKDPAFLISYHVVMFFTYIIHYTITSKYRRTSVAHTGQLCSHRAVMFTQGSYVLNTAIFIIHRAVMFSTLQFSVYTGQLCSQHCNFQYTQGSYVLNTAIFSIAICM